MHTRRLGRLSLSFLLFVLPVTACGSGEDCDETKYDTTPSSVLACQSGKLSVRSMPCFGAPDTCSYVATGAKLTFTVAKTTCRSSSDTSASMDGCATSPVDFDCSGPTLAPGTYEIGGAGQVLSIDVAADGSCTQH